LKRSRFVKYFETADKGCAAVVYPEAVHFEEDGEWKEIDHTLVEDERAAIRRTVTTWPTIHALQEASRTAYPERTDRRRRLY